MAKPWPLPGPASPPGAPPWPQSPASCAPLSAPSAGASLRADTLNCVVARVRAPLQTFGRLARIASVVGEAGQAESTHTKAGQAESTTTTTTTTTNTNTTSSTTSSTTTTSTTTTITTPPPPTTTTTTRGRGRVRVRPQVSRWRTVCAWLESEVG
jgi:hypothetical protein